MLAISRGRFALSASLYLHFIYLSKQHKCNALPKQTKVEKGMDRYRALPLLTCGPNPSPAGFEMWSHLIGPHSKGDYCWENLPKNMGGFLRLNTSQLLLQISKDIHLYQLFVWFSINRAKAKKNWILKLLTHIRDLRRSQLTAEHIEDALRIRMNPRWIQFHQICYILGQLGQNALWWPQPSAAKEAKDIEWERWRDSWDGIQITGWKCIILINLYYYSRFVTHANFTHSPLTTMFGVSVDSLWPPDQHLIATFWIPASSGLQRPSEAGHFFGSNSSFWP